MYERLMEEVVRPENCRKALRAVERNGGAPGNDGMTTKELRGHLGRNWGVIRERLLAGKYLPSPLRGAEIPKPGGGTRALGIPNVQDRFVHQLLLQVLTPIFDPNFSESSYGFRPGRNAHDAVRAAQRFAREGRTWVVDLDIRKFFDLVHHDILMRRIGETIRDKRVLKLIGRYLRRGVMVEGVAVRNERGTPQGGPLSPLLANIYLDVLDKELEKRGHAFSRYADDCNIYVKSEAAARRVLASISGWMRKCLKLEVNEEKSGIGRIWELNFLGFVLTPELEIKVSLESLRRFKDRVREAWRGCQSLTSEQLRDNWRVYLRGWWNYYRLAENRRDVLALEGWIRRHIRRCFWLRWHDWRGRLRAFRRLGLKDSRSKVAWSSRGAWLIANSPTLKSALSNRVLRHYGFLVPSDLVTV